MLAGDVGESWKCQGAEGAGGFEIVLGFDKNRRFYPLAGVLTTVDAASARFVICWSSMVCWILCCSCSTGLCSVILFADVCRCCTVILFANVPLLQRAMR